MTRLPIIARITLAKIISKRGEVMKKYFEEPKMTVAEFSIEDIISVSGPSAGGNVGGTGGDD